jgi:hypothetical protein
MRRLDLLTPHQIRDRPCQLQDAMIRPRRKVELAHRRTDETVACFIEFAEFTHLGHAHIGVADDVCPGEALQLTLAGGLHPCANGLLRFAQPIAGEFFVIDARDFDVDVNSIQHRAGDAFLIFSNGRGAGAGFLAITEITARTGIPAIPLKPRGTFEPIFLVR